MAKAKSATVNAIAVPKSQPIADPDQLLEFDGDLRSFDMDLADYCSAPEASSLELVRYQIKQKPDLSLSLLNGSRRRHHEDLESAPVPYKIQKTAPKLLFRMHARSIIVSVLTVHTLIKLSHILHIADIIESNCFQFVCGLMNPYRHDPDDPADVFVKTYKIYMGKILCNLDPDTDVGSKYIIGAVYDFTMRRFHRNEDVDDHLIMRLAPYNNANLCPEKTAPIIKLIHEKMSQRARCKVSTAYTCSGCGKRETTLKGVQLRSLDEGENIQVTCVSCKKTWIM